MPASCVVVREQLAEYAVGVLSERDRSAVERHLQWCAGCRKEAGELSGAAATIAYALPPASVPEGLLGRILSAIARAARIPAFRRRARSAGTLAVAALVAVSALGWGAVMAGRAQRYEVRAQAEAQRRTAALQQFQKAFQYFRALDTGLPDDRTLLARLAPSSGVLGGGAALQLVSPTMLDFVVVHVAGLPRDRRSLPYRIWVEDADGNALRAGRLTELDADGAGEAFHQFSRADLSGYTTVVVRNARGEIVLRGVAEPASG